MTLTTAERLTVDGVDLKTLAKNVETLGATLRTPARRGANAVAAGRSGEIWTSHKPHEAGSFALPMWVVGCDDDGLIPSGSNERIEFFKRVDELTEIFTTSGTLLDVRHTLPDGSVRQAFCEAVAIFDYTTTGSSPVGKMTIELQIPESYWQAITDTSTTDATLAAFTVASDVTAPLDDGVFVITGPVTNPQILDVTSGHFFQYNAAIAASQTLTVNAKTWTITGGGGLTANYGLMVVSGNNGRLMRLVPNASRQWRADLNGSGTSSATRLVVTARRKFLVG